MFTDAMVDAPVFLTTPFANSPPVDGSIASVWFTTLTSVLILCYSQIIH